MAVLVTRRACSGSTCSAASTGYPTEGSFLPGVAVTIKRELEGCPSHPDRIAVDVSRWGSTNISRRVSTSSGRCVRATAAPATS